MTKDSITTPTIPDTLENALLRAHTKLCAYVGVCKDDKELVKIIKLVSEALLIIPEIRPQFEPNLTYFSGDRDE